MISALLSDVSILWLLVLFIVGAVVITLLGWWILHRTVKKDAERGGHNEVVGLLFTMIGGLYAILLAFIIVDVWTDFHAADNAVTQEASAVMLVADYAGSLPAPAAHEFRQKLGDYVETVMNDEWQTMANNWGAEVNSPKAEAQLADLWRFVHNVPPDQQKDSLLAGALGSMTQYRVVRLMSSNSVVPDIFWLILFLGMLLLIFLSLMLYMDNSRLHLALVIILSIMLAISLWIIAITNNPFAGDVHVTPDALQFTLKIIHQMLKT